MCSSPRHTTRCAAEIIPRSDMMLPTGAKAVDLTRQVSCNNASSNHGVRVQVQSR
ncbi:hypothetical protein PAMP_002079 [Pampus punctatissimus]